MPTPTPSPALATPAPAPAGASNGTGAVFFSASPGNSRAFSSPSRTGGAAAPAPAAARPAPAAGSSRAATIFSTETAKAGGTSTSAACSAARSSVGDLCVFVSAIINSARSLSENDRYRSSSAITLDTTFRCCSRFKGSPMMIDGANTLRKQPPELAPPLGPPQDVERRVRHPRSKRQLPVQSTKTEQKDERSFWRGLGTVFALRTVERAWANSEDSSHTWPLFSLCASSSERERSPHCVSYLLVNVTPTFQEVLLVGNSRKQLSAVSPATVRHLYLRVTWKQQSCRFPVTPL